MPKFKFHQVFWKEHSKDRDQFAKTPPQLLEQLTKTYGTFDFDPCPANPTFDGLEVEWGQNNYVNPPFNDLRRWLTKAVTEYKKGRQVIFLMPIRIHTHYFLDLVQPLLDGGEVQAFILRGGLVFQGYQTKTPFGLMYLVFPGGYSKATPSIQTGSNEQQTTPPRNELDTRPAADQEGPSSLPPGSPVV